MAKTGFGPGFLPRLLEYLCETVPGSCGAGMSVVNDGDAPRVTAAVGVAQYLDNLQWDLMDGPLVVARETEQVVKATSIVDEQWPRFSEALAGTKLDDPKEVSGLFVPGIWDQTGPILLSVYLSPTPGAKTLRQVDRLEPLLAIALGMAEFCAGEHLRAENMLIMMQYRRIIEQAKGLIMGTMGCNADEAFRTLVRSSQHFGAPVRDLSVALVELVGGEAVEHPDDPEYRVDVSDDDRKATALMWAALHKRDGARPA